MATRVLNVNDILDGHVGLDLECFDRIYLNGWVPNLQVGGQVVNFLTHHLGFPIPSPAILEKIGLRFRKAVTEFAAAPFQHLRPDPGRATNRDLLHQGPQPAPPATRRGQRPTHPATPAPSPPGDRPTRHRLHRPGPHDRLKTWLKIQTPSVQGR